VLGLTGGHDTDRLISDTEGVSTRQNTGSMTQIAGLISACPLREQDVRTFTAPG